tara:strand:+ start:123876 stop:126356 length:2481 start_codon:yes stop_codon:yes gene_type:complete
MKIVSYIFLLYSVFTPLNLFAQMTLNQENFANWYASEQRIQDTKISECSDLCAGVRSVEGANACKIEMDQCKAGVVSQLRSKASRAYPLVSSSEMANSCSGISGRLYSGNQDLYCFVGGSVKFISEGDGSRVRYLDKGEYTEGSDWNDGLSSLVYSMGNRLWGGGDENLIIDYSQFSSLVDEKPTEPLVADSVGSCEGKSEDELSPCRECLGENQSQEDVDNCIAQVLAKQESENQKDLANQVTGLEQLGTLSDLDSNQFANGQNAAVAANSADRYYYGNQQDKTTVLSDICKGQYGLRGIEREGVEQALANNQPPQIVYQEGTSPCEREVLPSFQSVIANGGVNNVHEFAEQFCNGNETCQDKIYRVAGYTGAVSTWAWFKGQIDPSIWDIVDRTIKGQDTKDYENCETMKANAVKCCGDPMTCAVGGNQGVGSAANLVLTLGTMIQTQRGAQGNAEACRTAKDLSLAGAGLNTGLAALCTGRVEGCKSVCENSEQVFKNAGEVLTNLCSGMSSLNSVTGLCTKSDTLNRKGRDMKSKVATCQNSSETATALAQQATANTAMAAFLQECEDELTTSESGFEGLPSVDIAFNGDCTTAANASNPICIACNANPDADGCDGIATLGTSTTGSTVDAGTLGTAVTTDISSLGADLGLLDDPFSNPEFADPMAVEANQLSDPTVSSSGGGANLGGGSSSGGLPPEQEQGSVNGPLDTDILTGERGGSGAVSSTGFSSGGGFSYGRSPAALAEKSLVDAHKKSGFDLSKYLPGSKGKAKLPGLGRQPAGVGKMTDDIFQMVSRRYRLRCLQGKFYGCPGGGSAPARSPGK